MTDTWAAKVLADVPRWTIDEGRGAFLSEAEVLDAIAKLADGGGLVDRATAALEGVTDGPWAVEYKYGTIRLLMGNEVAMCDEKYYPWTPENDKDWHFIAFTRQWVPEAAARIAALTAQNQTWQRNSRETFDAMVAMRNSINEHLPMPSLESDLLQGPENSVFCAAVAEAVVSEVHRLRAKVALLEGALRPFCFFNEDEPESDVQRAWEIRYQDRFKDWIDFGDIVAARAALTDGGKDG